MMWVILHFFCYIDGVYTIIDMATAYGTALGLDSTGLLLALLVTQIVAFPSALIFGRLSQKYESKHLIPICIVAYTVIAVLPFSWIPRLKGAEIGGEFLWQKRICKISENCDLSHKLWYNYDNLECGRFFLWIVFMWRLHRLQKIRPM